MNERAVLVHGYWISNGASLLSERQADAAARLYLMGDVNLILIPAGMGEWGQGSIGQFIKERILNKYQDISPARVIALNDKRAINTKREIDIGLRYLKKRGVRSVLDLAAPFHRERVKWIVDDIERYSKEQIISFSIEYKATSDYLTEEENKELFCSKLYNTYEKSEKIRSIIFKNRILNFLANLLPDEIKVMTEALLANKLR